MSGLTPALGWNCGCRAVGVETGAYTLITCESHLDVSARTARLVTFR